MSKTERPSDTLHAEDVKADDCKNNQTLNDRELNEIVGGFLIKMKPVYITSYQS